MDTLGQPYFLVEKHEVNATDMIRIKSPATNLFFIV